MSWGAIVGGVATVGAGYLSGKQKQGSSTQVELPAWLQSQLEEIPSLAKGRVLDRDPQDVEDMVAGLDPRQRQAIEQLTQFGSEGGTGNEILDMLMGAGGGVNALNQGQGLIQQAADRGPAFDAGPDLGRAGEIADNPYMDSMVDSALRDPTRQFTEQQMPAARMAQAMSGNTGSTRGAIGEAVLERGYEDRAADIGAQLRGSAYNTGLGIESNRSARNANLESSYQQILGGLGTNLANTGGQSANVLQLANQIGLGNIQALMGGGEMLRGEEQSFLDAGRMNYNQPVQDLQMYTDLLGSVANPYTGNRSTTTGGNGVAGAMGGLSAWLGSDMASGLFGNPGGGGTAHVGGGNEDFYQSSINFLDPDELDLLPRS